MGCLKEILDNPFEKYLHMESVVFCNNYDLNNNVHPQFYQKNYLILYLIKLKVSVKKKNHYRSF